MRKMLLALIGVVFTTPTFAHRHLFIENQTSQPISLKVIFDSKRDLPLPITIPGGHTKALKLEKKDLNGVMDYALKGTMPPFFKDDKCTKLKPDQDYTIIFTDEGQGTTCHSYIREGTLQP